MRAQVVRDLIAGQAARNRVRLDRLHRLLRFPGQRRAGSDEPGTLLRQLLERRQLAVEHRESLVDLTQDSARTPRPLAAATPLPLGAISHRHILAGHVTSSTKTPRYVTSHGWPSRGTRSARALTGAPGDRDPGLVRPAGAGAPIAVREPDLGAILG